MKLFLSAINDSLTLLSFRLESAKAYQKLLGFLLFVGLISSVLALLNINSVIRAIMELRLRDIPTAETVVKLKEFIGTYLGMYTSGDIDTFVSITVALLLGSIVFVPFSGHIIHGVVSHSELVILKNGDNYKLGDSVVFQVISSFTFTQVLGLTLASQLLTFDSDHSGYAAVFVWAIWVVVTLLTVLLSWIVEYVSRKYGKRTRTSFLIFAILCIAILVLLDPDHGTTLFGASQISFDFLQQLATGDMTLLLGSLAVIACLSLLTIYAITGVAASTLRLPEPLSISKTNEKQVRSSSTNPVGPIKMLSRLLFRYTAITKPVITAVVFSVAIILILGGRGGLSAVMIVLPLSVAVSFGANIFGLVSGAMNWLLTIEGWRSKIFNAATLLTFAWISAVYGILLGVGWIAQSITTEDITFILPSLIATTAATTVLSIWLSAKYPLSFSGKARENLISSPIRLIVYVGVILGVTAIVANITFYANGWYAWALCGFVTAISACCYFVVWRTWNYTEKYTSQLLKETINAG